MSDYKDPLPNDFFIGKGVIFKGEAMVPNKAIINGDFSGLLDAQNLEIQTEGVITGNINASGVKVFGRLNSELNCKNLLIIESTGEVKGKLKYGQIEIARGGKVIGNISQSWYLMGNDSTHNQLSEEDCAKLDELCLWIDANISTSISWTELTVRTGWQHSDLIKKFVLYKGTTPMSYIIDGIKKKS